MAHPTDIPCPAFGVGCGGFLDEHGVCTTCGAVAGTFVDRRRDLVDEVIDEAFDPPGPYDNYTERDLEELADEAAGRYEDWLFRDRD